MREILNLTNREIEIFLSATAGEPDGDDKDSDSDEAENISEEDKKLKFVKQYLKEKLLEDRDVKFGYNIEKVRKDELPPMFPRKTDK